MNKKTNKKTAKAAKKTAPKYTRLTTKDIGEIIAEATTELIRDERLAEDICATFEVEAWDEAAGTYFITYAAESEHDAKIFNAATIGMAAAFGYFAEPSERWEDEHDAEGGRRAVSVFVCAANYMANKANAKA